MAVCGWGADVGQNPSSSEEGQRDLRACSLVAAGWCATSCVLSRATTPNPSSEEEGLMNDPSRPSADSLDPYHSQHNSGFESDVSRPFRHRAHSPPTEPCG